MIVDAVAPLVTVGMGAFSAQVPCPNASRTTLNSKQRSANVTKDFRKKEASSRARLRQTPCTQWGRLVDEILESKTAHGAVEFFIMFIAAFLLGLMPSRLVFLWEIGC